jgi:hypothetical protein
VSTLAAVAVLVRRLLRAERELLCIHLDRSARKRLEELERQRERRVRKAERRAKRERLLTGPRGPLTGP